MNDMNIPEGLTPEEEAWFRREMASPIVETTNTAEAVAKLRKERDAAYQLLRNLQINLEGVENFSQYIAAGKAEVAARLINSFLEGVDRQNAE